MRDNVFDFHYYLYHATNRPTVGFSGSGGMGKTPSPKNYFAGSRRVPSAAKPLSAANGVGTLLACNRCVLYLHRIVAASKEFHTRIVPSIASGSPG